MSREDVDRTVQFHELRFAKKQQWTIVTATLTLLGAIYGIARAEHLSNIEKAVATVLLTLAAASGITFLYSLHEHLKKTRLALNVKDPDPWTRGVLFVRVLSFFVFVSAVVVFHFLWFPHSSN